jgi:hypothetical protein
MKSRLIIAAGLLSMLGACAAGADRDMPAYYENGYDKGHYASTYDNGRYDSDAHNHTYNYGRTSL